MRRLIIAVAVWVCVLSGYAHAEMKIGVFDLQKVVAESEALKSGQQEMAKRYAGKKQELEQKQKQAEQLADKLMKSSDEAAQQAYKKAYDDYVESANTYRRNLQDSDLKLRQRMDAVIIAAAKQLAGKKGYTLILDNKAAIYYPDSMDVTSEMLQIVNLIWKDHFK